MQGVEGTKRLCVAKPADPKPGDVYRHPSGVIALLVKTDYPYSATCDAQPIVDGCIYLHPTRASFEVLADLVRNRAWTKESAHA
jgi:hypothetical protein